MLGIARLAQQYLPNGVMTTAEAFLTVKGGAKGVVGHFTTYESAVLGFGNAEELRELRRQRGKITLNYKTPKLSVKTGPFRDERVPNRACYLFMGADSSVVS